MEVKIQSIYFMEMETHKKKNLIFLNHHKPILSGPRAFVKSQGGNGRSCQKYSYCTCWSLMACKSGSAVKKYEKHWSMVEQYCIISVNSAGHVICYMPAKILNSAHERNVCYIVFFFGRQGRMAMYLIHFTSLGGFTFQYFNILIQRALHNT